MAKVVLKPKKKAKGYKMPEPLPTGLILEDLNKTKWKLGPSIGVGGFGEIYSAMKNTAGAKSNYPFVIKIEPHENGPLFVEMHFYIRVGKPADIQNFKKTKGLNGLGMPEYIAHGSHYYNDVKYRFLVMERFGTDLYKLFTDNNRRFPAITVFNVGIQILQVIEYIHSKGYIHGDIKGANILLGLGRESSTQVYLVDFGLCTKFDEIYKPNPKQAHNGTQEYVSRDGHNGVPSRRGDLEILGYNLIHWLCCELPWEGDNLLEVQKKKEKYMKDLPAFFKTCFGKEKPPVALVNFFKYVVALKYEVQPDYEKLYKILQAGVKESGGTDKSPFEFNVTTSKSPSKRELSPVSSKSPKKTKKAKNDDTQENDVQSSKRTKKTEEVESPTRGYTEEMKRMKEKLDQRKKNGVAKVSTSSRPMRNRQAINYNEKVLSDRSHDQSTLSVDIVSDSEDEKPKRSKRK